MKVNFKSLQEYPVNIHNFNYNVDTMVNSIYVGPQGELLEQINDFNAQYGVNIGVTKNFTLKPGGYNQLKEAYGKWVLRWDMKPSGISSIFRRIREYGWRFNGFKDAAINIESTMASLRSSGLQWQNNANDFGIELEKVKSIIINSLERCKEMYPNVTVEVKMIPMLMDRDTSRHRLYGGRRSLPELRRAQDLPETIDYCVVFVVHIKSPTMTIHILRSDETVEQIETGCGDIIVASGASLLQMIGRNWGKKARQHGAVPTRNSNYYLEAIYLDSMQNSKHPYISHTCDAYAYELDGSDAFCNNICTGNMQEEFKNTIVNSQIEAHITYLVTWLTNYYIPQTNPLNRIKLLKRYGQDRQFADLRSRGHSAFDTISEPESCGFGTNLGNQIKNYAKGREPSTYGTLSATFTVTDIAYVERALEYIQRIEINDFPCHTCIHDMDCNHQTNILLLFQLAVLEPMEEAYIGMFVELHELDTHLHNRTPIVFIEQLINDAFRWRIDEEYDKLIQCNYITQLFCQNEISNNDIISWTNRRYTDVMCVLWVKTEHTINELYKIYTLNGGCLWDWARLSEFDVETPLVDEQLHNEDQEMEEVLEDLATAVLTPEEMTLRWASRNGGANNL